jgi:hypothetical protein
LIDDADLTRNATEVRDEILAMPAPEALVQRLTSLAA